MDTVAQQQLLDGLEAAKTELRSECRIKLGCDYAVTLKYWKVHVLCGAVYEDYIREVFAKHGVAIETLHSYQ